MSSLKCPVAWPAYLFAVILVSSAYYSSLSGTLKLLLVVGLQTTPLLAPNYVSTLTISFLQVVFSEFFWTDLLLTSPTQSSSSVHYL